MTPRIDHLGIVVNDLDAAIARVRAHLKVEPEGRKLPGAGLNLAVFRAANVGIELLA